MDHTKRLLEITRYTREAINLVDRGYDPWYQYMKIRGLTTEDHWVKKILELQEFVAEFFLAFGMFASSASCFFFAGMSLHAFIHQESLWPSFFYAILFSATLALAYRLKDYL